MIRRLLFTLTSLAVLPCGATAGSISWGSAVADKLYDSEGSPLTSDYSFEMGTFSGGFEPTAANLGDWAGSWKLLEKADFITSPLYFTENSLLATSGPGLVWERDAVNDPPTPASNPNVFFPGERVYVWAYNSKASGTPVQWALLTGTGSTSDTDWVLTADMGDELAMTLQWRLSNATTPVYGGLNNLRGPGGYSAEPATYSLQTALVVTIPEPSATGLLTAIFLLPLNRRRRPSTCGGGGANQC
ncbi:MAG: hypothetical protein JWL81_224 [Verrucomicrobiales bacterium]|nr:hypothetical protein [Verrucomicrobiales bacterium]